MNYKAVNDAYWKKIINNSSMIFSDEQSSIAEEVMSSIGFGSVLDIGCGLGDLVLSLNARGIDAIGVDVSSVAIEEAKLRSDKRFFEHSALSLPFDDDSFETVIGVEVLEHLDITDVVLALKEVFRVCKKNAYFLIGLKNKKEASCVLTNRDRFWWESVFFEVGFRKHSSYYIVNEYNSLNNDSSKIKLVMEKVEHHALKKYPLKALVKERDLHMDMMRESGERSDAHIYRYYAASKQIRYGDKVLDAACGLGYGSYVLEQNSLASKVIGIDGSKYAVDYATASYGSENISFVEGYLPDALSSIPDNSIDFITSFETIEHVVNPEILLKEFYRVLSPGGRIFVSVPNDWSDESGKDPNPYHFHVYTWDLIVNQLEQFFDVESAYIQTASRCKDKSTGYQQWKKQNRLWSEVKGTFEHLDVESEWCILCAMKSPCIKGVAYKESVFPFNNVNNNVIAFQRDYAFPWIIRAIVSIGLRANNSTLLSKYSNDILSYGDELLDADRGAALCVLAYQLEKMGDHNQLSNVVLEIRKFLEKDSTSPNHYRWIVSLNYFLGYYYKGKGDFVLSLFYYNKCSGYDVSKYHPALATKVTEACFWAGIIESSINLNINAACDYWKKGVIFAFNLLKTDPVSIYDVIESPLIFAIDEFSSVFDNARKCANALYSVSLGKCSGSYFSQFLFNSKAKVHEDKRWLEGQVSILNDELTNRSNWIKELETGKEWLELENHRLMQVNEAARQESELKRIRILELENELKMIKSTTRYKILFGNNSNE